MVLGPGCKAVKRKPNSLSSSRDRTVGVQGALCLV